MQGGGTIGQTIGNLRLGKVSRGFHLTLWEMMAL